MRPPVLFAAAALALASPLVAQTLVYSLPGETGGTFSYLTISEEVEYADSVSLLAGFRPADVPLWTSGPVVFQLEGDGANNLNLNQLIFADIRTLVPDDLFWSVKFENISNYSDGGAFGPKLEDAADLAPTGAATDPSRLYVRGELSEGEWMPIWISTPAPPTSTLSLQLTASPVPEPSATLLAALAAGLMLRRRRA
jgi:hypothetical protein